MISYTAIFGGYDAPRRAPDGEAVLFTDRPPGSDLGWRVWHLEPPCQNLARANRAVKLQPHAYLDSDRVLYLDGSMRLTVTPEEALRVFQREAGGDHDVFVLRHSLGHNLGEDFTWLRSKRIVAPHLLDQQEERYAHLKNHLTVEARLLIAKLPEANTFLDCWWQEVRTYSHRDQISFPYAAWKTKADVRLVPFQIARPLFTNHRHRRPQLRSAA